MSQPRIGNLARPPAQYVNAGFLRGQEKFKRLDRGEGSPWRRSLVKRDLNRLYRRVMLYGPLVVDKRTAANRYVLKWKARLITDLGGDGALKSWQLDLVDDLVKYKLLLNHLDAMLLGSRTLFTRNAKTLKHGSKAIMDLRIRLGLVYDRKLMHLTGGIKQAESHLPSLRDELLGQDQKAPKA